MLDCLSKINNAEVKNQIIVKIIDKYLNFFTFKGCIHFNGQNFSNINNINNIKFIFWLVSKI